MRLGMIGLGKMGLNMSRRLIKDGHEIFAYDALLSAREAAASYGIKTFESIASMTEGLGPKKIVWIMLPDTIVEQVCNELKLLLKKEDIVIDGGNCHFEESIKKFNSFATLGIEFMDVGVSGGVFGLDRGYCLMIGGNKHTFDYLKPIFKSLSPLGNPTEGFLYCGKSGAGHYVKMIHNAIEYGLMQSYAEGFEMLVNANKEHLAREQRYDFDIKEIAQVWRYGSVVSSWLLDLISSALHKDEKLASFSGNVADSGEGRWALIEAIKQNTPAGNLANSLFARFRSRQDSSVANKILSALRAEFGGHKETKGK